jgi:hypothetical protein
MDRLADGLGQSVPFINAGFQTPRVTSAEKQLTIVARDAGRKSARSLRPEECKYIVKRLDAELQSSVLIILK